MKKVDKVTQERLFELADQHNALVEKANEKIEKLNEAIDEISGEITSAVDELNELRREIKSEMDAIGNDIQAYIDERSEKWVEGERGQAFVEWQESYAQFELEDVDPDLPRAVELIEAPENLLEELDFDAPST